LKAAWNQQDQQVKHIDSFGPSVDHDNRWIGSQIGRMARLIRDAMPLVTVGIPCFNRADLLLRAVRAVQAQTYQNLEIIVSDNASTDPEVEKTCRELAAKDRRMLYVRQPVNLGAMANFEFVLQKATADYFMWAADDDWIEPSFVQICLDAHLENGSTTVLVTPEAQYETTDGAEFPFFSEGCAFRSELGVTSEERIQNVLRHGFGNLIYGLFRRDTLFHNGQPITQWIKRTRNELPLFVLVALKGKIVSLPKVLWHKRAPAHVCQSARWESLGGWKSTGPGLLTPRHMFVSQRKYHQDLDFEIALALRDSGLAAAQQDRIIASTRQMLRQHWRAVLIGWKPHSNLITLPV
jgi:glycosyltransferase involved in cell wall biosynthesis